MQTLVELMGDNQTYRFVTSISPITKDQPSTFIRGEQMNIPETELPEYIIKWDNDRTEAPISSQHHIALWVINTIMGRFK